MATFLACNCLFAASPFLSLLSVGACVPNNEGKMKYERITLIKSYFDAG